MTLNKRRACYLGCLLLLALWAGDVMAVVTGQIAAGGGSLERISASGEVRSANVLSQVEIGDTLMTGADGWAVIAMLDGASLTLRANTHLRIDDYRYQADRPSESRAWIGLLKGALRSVTGLIGRSSPPAYRLDTPTATMGIRGTDHETVVLSAGGESPAGTYDLVNDGETVMQSGETRLAIKAGESGFTPQEPGALPTLLADRPRLFERLHRLAQDQGADVVLEQLHEHSGKGFRARQLTPEQRAILIERGRDALLDRQQEPRVVPEVVRQKLQNELKRRRQQARPIRSGG